MSSVAMRLARHLNLSVFTRTHSPFPVACGLQGSSNALYSSAPSSGTSDNDNDNENDKVDDFIPPKKQLYLQGVDPQKGWGFRGVHKAIICGKIGSPPVQKILRSGRTVTIFTVGTGGMFDQRLLTTKDSPKAPKPAQWHRIAVHNDDLSAYAIQKLVKNSSVYVEGDIETRVYNDSINGTVKNIPEICVRRDGRICLIKSGESISNINLDELRKGLL